MDERTRELIAIGASVSAHCQPCLDYHMREAWGLGIDEGDVREALEVGRMVENGASTAMTRYADLLFTLAQSEGIACCAGGNSERSA